MKLFLIRIALFFAIVAVLDFSIGRVFNYLQANVAGGRTGAEYYVCKKATEDIIILGSSRASHHYVPSIITDSLGLSYFNGGQDGNGIILHYGRWQMLAKRHIPKILIYDVTPDFDLRLNDNMAYVDRLKPFCSDSVVKGYVSSLFPMERIKLVSNFYRYNYKCLELLSDCVLKEDFLYNGGYVPLTGHIRPEIINRAPKSRRNSIELDYVKLSYLDSLVYEATSAGTIVVLTVSPSWQGGDYSVDVYDVIESIARKYGALFYEYIDAKICEEPDSFEDSSHLNDDGAKALTKDLVSKIVERFKDRGKDLLVSCSYGRCL